jgi:hypothetical protein
MPSPMISPTDMRGLSEAKGSWKIICMRRRSGRCPLRDRPPSSCPSNARCRPGRHQLQDGLADRRLAATRLADQRQRAARASSSETPSTARTCRRCAAGCRAGSGNARADPRPRAAPALARRHGGHGQRHAQRRYTPRCPRPPGQSSRWQRRRCPTATCRQAGACCRHDPRRAGSAPRSDSRRASPTAAAPARESSPADRRAAPDRARRRTASAYRDGAAMKRRPRVALPRRSRRRT